MACMTVPAPETAMATMELKRAASHGSGIPWAVEPMPKHGILRMSWVVVTDEHGTRRLCSLWSVAPEYPEQAA